MRSDQYFRGYQVGKSDAENELPYDYEYAPEGSPAGQGYDRGYRAYKEGANG